MKTFVYRLKALEGPEKGKSWLLTGDRFTLGRGKDNVLCIIDMAASKNHCEIIRSGDHYYLKDLRSRNGTWLNGVKLTAKQLYDIPPGAEIKMGSSILHVSMEEVDEDEFADLDQDTMEAEGGGAGLGSPTAYMGLAEGHGEGRLRKMKERTIPFTLDSGRNVAGIYKVLSIIGATADKRYLMDKTVELTLELVGAERGFLFLAEDLDRGSLLPGVARTMQAEGQIPIESISRSVINQALAEGSSILSSDVPADQRFVGSDSLISYAIQSVICAPIKSRDEVLGLLYFDSTSTTKVLRREDLDLITALGIQVGIIMENMDLISGYHGIVVSFGAVMVRLLEARYQGYAGHSERVASLSLAMADALGMSPKGKESLHLAALLHDVGQFAVPPEILNREGKLTDQELLLVRSHPEAGRRAFGGVTTFDRAVEGILHHHERIDGSGYPAGLSGEAIPLPARIIAVAECFDALVSPRPHRGPVTAEQALREILKLGGIFYDLNVVRALHQAIQEGRIMVKEGKGA